MLCMRANCGTTKNTRPVYTECTINWCPPTSSCCFQNNQPKHQFTNYCMLAIVVPVWTPDQYTWSVLYTSAPPPLLLPPLVPLWIPDQYTSSALHTRVSTLQLYYLRPPPPPFSCCFKNNPQIYQFTCYCMLAIVVPVWIPGHYTGGVLYNSVPPPSLSFSCSFLNNPPTYQLTYLLYAGYCGTRMNTRPLYQE